MQAIQTLTKPNVPEDNVRDFFWRHMEMDVLVIQKATGKSAEDVYLLLHCICKNFMTEDGGFTRVFFHYFLCYMHYNIFQTMQYRDFFFQFKGIRRTSVFQHEKTLDGNGKNYLQQRFCAPYSRSTLFSLNCIFRLLRVNSKLRSVIFFNKPSFHIATLFQKMDNAIQEVNAEMGKDVRLGKVSK